MTLLETALEVPELPDGASAGEPAGARARQWPTSAALFPSFATVAIVWLDHRAVFGLVRETDPRFLVANALALLLVVVVPLPTDSVALYLGTPASAAAAAACAGTFLAVTLAFNLLWQAANRGGLLEPTTSAAYARTLTRNDLIALPLYAAAVAVAFWRASASMGICLLLWIFWALTAPGRPRAG